MVKSKGSLPLVLIFEVSEEQDIGIERCNKIMELLNVIISVRLKQKFGTYAVHIKGLERNAEKLYKSRQMLLDSNEPPVLAEIPQSYFGNGTFINTDDSLASSNVSTTSSTGMSPMASPRSGSISLQGIDSGYGETHEESRPVGGISINECGQQLEQLGDKALKICSDYEEMQAMAAQGRFNDVIYSLAIADTDV
ncbi:protein bicaudal C homolog 1-B-like [Hetaerina americana]|uniref:protein bicaudal C homolog 1-B-like n=1 Tax=Hetaerina americana TaxID=62018 RepID=UPI003A7F3E5B